MPARAERRRAPWMLVGLLVAGCAVGPAFQRPAAPADRYLSQSSTERPGAAATAEPRFDFGAAVPREWWREFGCEPLDDTVRLALAHSATLEAAVATLRQSEYALRAGYGVFLPQIDLDLNATRQRFSPARFGQTGAGSVFNLFTVSGAVSYALDVFGGARRRVEGLRADVEAARALGDAAALTLEGNVVNAVVAGAAYRAQIAATRTAIDAAREQVALTEVRVRAGTAAEATLLALRAQVAALEVTLPPLAQKADQTDHLLAQLVGTTAAQWTPPAADLEEFRLPQDLPVALPSQLVRRRPDLVAAEANLHAASAALGVATADLFPQITLSGNAGGNAARLGQLDAQNARFWSAGADLSLPLFHGGTLWYTRRAAREAYRAALADYRQTVLAAFQQVADSLRALEHDADLLDAAGRADRDAQLALLLTRANYDAGTADYLAVLDATQRAANARIAALTALAQRLQDTTALYMAIGGGGSAGAQPGA